MADADEAVGNDVEQEATEELVDGEVQDLDPIAVGVVAPAKADVSVGEVDQTVVGEGDAMGVATEIGEHMLGSGKRGLAVDDPRRLAQFGKPRSEGRWLSEGGQAVGEMSFTPIERPLQAGEIAPAEDLSQGADGKEERGPGWNPACAVRGEGAAGDDTVDVNMLRKILAPRVEYGRHAHVAPEVTRIAPEAQEGGGRALKEQAIDQPRVTLRQRIERVGQREDDVEVGNGQDVAAAGDEPTLGGHALAFGAVAVATGVVGDAFGAARRADGAMAAERGGAAGRDGLQGAVLNARQAMRAAIVRGGRADDLGELEARRALTTDAREDGRGRRHDSGAWRFREIEGRAGGQHPALGDVDIAGGGGQVTVAEQVLDRREVAARFE